MLITIGLSLNAVFLGLGAWASLRHFSRKEREPRGASLLTLATLSGTAVNVWLSLRDPEAGSYDDVLAISFSLIALGVFIAAIRATRLGGLSLAFSERTPGAVIDTGIYRVIRHPFYSSYILYWLSWLPFTSFNPLAGVVAGIMIAAYTLAAQKEERLLTARLGSPYSALVRRTWRFVPGIH